MITGVHFTRASDEQIESGLMGFVRAEYGDLVLDGITLRRTQAGRFALSWPCRRDRQGREHAYIRPQDDAARRALEEEVIAAIIQKQRPAEGQP